MPDLTENEIKILEGVLKPPCGRLTLSVNEGLTLDILNMYFFENLKPKAIERRIGKKMCAKTVSDKILKKYPLYKEFLAWQKQPKAL